MSTFDRRVALGPVAATAGGVKDQPIGTVLEVCLAHAALVELVLVGWVWEHSVALAHAEGGAHALGSRVRAATGAASPTGAASTVTGHTFDRWQGSRRGSASCRQMHRDILQCRP